MNNNCSVLGSQHVFLASNRVTWPPVAFLMAPSRLWWPASIFLSSDHWVSVSSEPSLFQGAPIWSVPCHRQFFFQGHQPVIAFVQPGCFFCGDSAVLRQPCDVIDLCFCTRSRRVRARAFFMKPLKRQEAAKNVDKPLRMLKGCRKPAPRRCFCGVTF